MFLVKENGVFTSIQGEGPFTGTPAIFVRTFGCNVKCSWCDTKESWEDESNKQEVEVIDVVNKVLQNPQRDVCITGGEPFLQAEELYTLTEILSGHEKFISIETNATIYYPIPFISFYVLSPKFGTWRTEIINKWINYFYSTETAFVIKIVCDTLEDVRAAKQRTENVPNRLVIQPLWKCEKYMDIVNYCIDNCINISAQIHKFIGLL